MVSPRPAPDRPVGASTSGEPGTESGEAGVPGTVQHVRALLERVVDPEIPVLSLADLGVLREVRVEGSRVTVVLTPTYSGCPAVDTMRADVRTVLAEAGYADVEVSLTLSPAWSTDWMSPAARRKLLDVGIAPPPDRAWPEGGPDRAGSDGGPAGRAGSDGGPAGRADGPVPVALTVRCPHCGSTGTRQISRFGSTACKSLWVCQDCLEPFDHFKAL